MLAFGAGVVVGWCGLQVAQAVGMWWLQRRGERIDVCCVERRQMWIRERR